MIAGLVAAAICWLLGDLIAPAVLASIQNNLSNLAENAYKVDSLINITTDTTVTTSIMTVFSTVGINLLILVFIKKGFETYVLYTDGDAESDPINMLTLFVKALFVAMMGNTILNWFAEIISNLSKTALDKVKDKLGTDYQWEGLVESVSKVTEDSIGTQFGSLLFIIIFGIIFWILYFKCMGYGFELFILKIAMPICAVGLVNSDKGIFKPYFMSLVKALVTIMIQIILTQLGFSILICGYKLNNLFMSSILGIICLVTAMRTPKLLSEFLIPTSGGNMLMKTYYSTSLARNVFRLFKH